mmetsp:Transcript_92650/g.267548  ORF Transcript_92650/g.267548 Transcript_92650/m.267548 type:complete len:231 (+) Transcript_92650:263-955(+)
MSRRSVGTNDPGFGDGSASAGSSAVSALRKPFPFLHPTPAPDAPATFPRSTPTTAATAAGWSSVAVAAAVGGQGRATIGVDASCEGVTWMPSCGAADRSTLSAPAGDRPRNRNSTGQSLEMCSSYARKSPTHLHTTPDSAARRSASFPKGCPNKSAWCTQRTVRLFLSRWINCTPPSDSPALSIGRMSFLRSSAVQLGNGHGTLPSPDALFFCFETWSAAQVRKQGSQNK